MWWIVHIQLAFTLPRSVHAWLNVITLSPIAEEILFRRVAIEHLQRQFGAAAALLGSSMLFSMIHLPWWALSAEQSLSETITGLVTMFVYGLVFGGLYLSAKSLWAPLIPHCINNLIATSIAA